MAAKRTVHFVYATPYSLLDKVSMRLLKRKLVHPEWQEFDWPKPLKAPLSITWNVARAIGGRYTVKLYDLKERLAPEPREGDILLGHAWPDDRTVVQRGLKDRRFASRYLIGPYNHDERQVGWMRDAVAECDAFFAICGRHWIDTFGKSPLAPFRDKVIHLNMAIDPGDYPPVKKDFAPPGKRKFFYIGRYGRYGDEKGVRLLEELAERIPGFSGGYICPDGEIRGWRKISGPTRLTPAVMAQIAGEYDVFINMSRADAQATTILEAVSWGFPVACTPESGYTEENFFYLDLNDQGRNVETIESIQRMSGEELAVRAAANRNTLLQKYSWEAFVTRLLDNMKP